jgi:16S rRNA (cytidine1402-2'-O)-methyltransferase
MPGTLHLVATPIGNLEDITLRALRVLREVALVAAEDTRRSAKLLTHYGITTPVLSYHAHNSRARLPSLLGRLAAGEDLALVTDAGTPGVSDPGTELVQACVGAGFPVNPVPGVSAPLAAAVSSGFPLVPFTFFGFAPHRSNDRESWLREIGATPHTFCFFEAPTRIGACLGQITELWGERQIIVARELTKLHQEFIRGTAARIRPQLPSPRGEFTIVVSPDQQEVEGGEEATDAEMVALFGQLVERPGVGRRDAISAVARACHKPARDVYAAIERAKNRSVD